MIDFAHETNADDDSAPPAELRALPVRVHLRKLAAAVRRAHTDDGIFPTWTDEDFDTVEAAAGRYLAMLPTERAKWSDQARWLIERITMESPDRVTVLLDRLYSGDGSNFTLATEAYGWALRARWGLEYIPIALNVLTEHYSDAGDGDEV
jgi:hypothetical protein